MDDGGERVEHRVAGDAHRAPDLLVCDYRLQADETGLTVAEAIRDEFNTTIPVLLVTGDVIRQSEASLAAQDVIVLHKPVAEHTLRAAIERAIGRDA